MMMKNKVALVTGSGRGIGRAIAQRLAEEGAHVYVSDIDAERAAAVAKSMSAQGALASALELNVAEESSWTKAIETISAETSRLDVLVNNAGITIAKYFEETTLDEWRQLMTINLESQFLSVKAVLPLMKKSAQASEFGGSIVNMSSVSGIIGTPVLAAYTTSKAGVRYFSKSIALDFAKRGYKIRVNTVHPGITEGESATVLFESRVRAGLSPTLSQAQSDWISNYPLARAAKMEEIANAVLFLASDQSSYVTGTELVVDGGLSAQ